MCRNLPHADSATAFDIELQLNGNAYATRVERWVTLLDLLREQADFTGVKKGCDHG